MISIVNRADLDVIKYDFCISNSLQSNIYAFSWYLDITCKDWIALVLDDYKAVMPVPKNRKYGVDYVYPPLWILELGVFTLEEIDIDEFIETLFSHFKFVELRLNTQNTLTRFQDKSVEKQMQYIPLSNDYETIASNYRKDRRKDLRKSENFDLIEKWNDHPDKLITLFKNNIGKRDPNIKENDYHNVLKLIVVCIERKVGDILSIYNKDNELVASAFFVKHKNNVTILLSSTNLENRKNGANTFLIDRAIYKYQPNYDIFNFGGSSIKTIADYFRSFNANESNYSFVKQNKLPFLMKLFKR
jgi:hemoglobin-like flavoprotein